MATTMPTPEPPSPSYRVHGPEDREAGFRRSRHGYSIEPDGTILALDEMQVHGAIAYSRDETVRTFYDALPEDDLNRTMTRASMFAVSKLGHVRISDYMGAWSLDWSRTLPLTPETLAALDFLAAAHGIDPRDEVMSHTGDAPWKTMRRRMASVGRAVAAREGSDEEECDNDDDRD